MTLDLMDDLMLQNKEGDGPSSGAVSRHRAMSPEQGSDRIAAWAEWFSGVGAFLRGMAMLIAAVGGAAWTGFLIFERLH